MLLETHDLGVRFGGIWALHDFTLSIEAGEVHGFIGPNGSGKSTFFNLVIGRYKPTTGRVHFRGQDITHLSPDERARLGITIKFQITNVFENLSVLDNVLIGQLGQLAHGEHHGRSRWTSWRTLDTSHAEELLEIAGLRDKRDLPAGTLAHGEKAWLEIAMALAVDPQLLLLDEPTAGMGPDETSRTVELVARIREGRTVLVIEHDMDFVRRVADSITVLYRGGILTEGTYDQVKRDERVISAYLGRS